jgi:hypothetical protein
VVQAVLYLLALELLEVMIPRFIIIRIPARPLVAQVITNIQSVAPQVLVAQPLRVQLLQLLTLKEQAQLLVQLVLREPELRVLQAQIPVPQAPAQ